MKRIEISDVEMRALKESQRKASQRTIHLLKMFHSSMGGKLRPYIDDDYGWFAMLEIVGDIITRADQAQNKENEDR